MPLTRGDHYAHFTILEFLGSGPTGPRYRVIDPESQATAHLRILVTTGSPDPARRQQLRRTHEILMRADIPGTDRILAVGDEGVRQWWIATEVITGVDAETLLSRRFPSGMPYQSLCLIADRAARTLEAAFSHGVTHGNVTPTNILLSNPFSTDYRIAVTDFGHRLATNTPADSTYAAPEVLAGAPADHRSDQFALAASMFHLLTGRPPFADRSRTVTTSGSLHFDAGALDSPSNAAIGLEQVFTRAFAFDPAARFRTCGEFVDALTTPERAQLKPADATAPRKPSRIGTPPKDLNEPEQKCVGRSILLPAAAAITVTAALTIAAFAIKPSARESAPSQTASPSAAMPIPSPAAPAAACGKLDSALAGLTLRQRLAQTLMVGVTGIEDARAVVDNEQVGGIFITSWTDLSMLTSGELHDLQSAARPIPLAVSVDEEGGRVQRLKSLIGDQDSPRQLVAEGKSAQQVHDIAFERGRKMRAYGITIDFAPVVDVTDAADETVIGDRSFGADADTVTEYAGAYAQGLRNAGMLPVLKHFPGHGRASGDSHQSGVTTPPLNDLMQADLIPYRTLTTVPPVAVMLGHMQVPGLTDNDPASLSAAAYSLLRDGRYGGPPFDGPIFTDDLSSMGAINQRYSVPEAVLKALQAGADTALWITTDEVPAALDRLEGAVKSGELPTARVDDAVRTMAVAKDPGLACTR